MMRRHDERRLNEKEAVIPKDKKLNFGVDRLLEETPSNKKEQLKNKDKL